MNTERIRVMIADAGYEMLGRQLEAYNGERGYCLKWEGSYRTLPEI